MGVYYVDELTTDRWASLDAALDATTDPATVNCTVNPDTARTFRRWLDPRARRDRLAER
jgi:hypothetical protein